LNSRAINRMAWIFLAPSLVLYAGYVLFPVVFSFYLSLTNWDGVAGFPRWMCDSSIASCFGNYLELFQDEIFWSSFKNNLIWLVFFSLSAPVGLGLAFLFHVKNSYSNLFKSLVFAPMVFSLVVVGTIWSWFLQPEFGLMEWLLKQFGLLGPKEQFGLMADFTWATAGLIVAASWPHAAYCMVLYLAGLSNLQKNVLEAATIDGATGFKAFWYMILPMLKPVTVIVFIVTLIGALRTFDLVSIMTAGGPANSSNVMALYMYQQTFESFRYGYGASIAVILFLISLFLIVMYLKKTKEV
jgi:multiple sugar transport system permease protein